MKKNIIWFYVANIAIFVLSGAGVVFSNTENMDLRIYGTIFWLIIMCIAISVSTNASMMRRYKKGQEDKSSAGTKQNR